MYICTYTRARWHYARISILIWGFAFAFVARASFCGAVNNCWCPLPLLGFQKRLKTPNSKATLVWQRSWICSELTVEQLTQQRRRATLCVCC